MTSTTTLGRNPLNIPAEMNGHRIVAFWNIAERKSQPAMAIVVGHRTQLNGARQVAVAVVTAESLERAGWATADYFYGSGPQALLDAEVEQRAIDGVIKLFERHDRKNLGICNLIAQFCR